MRKWKIIGYKKVQYKSKRTGRDVTGTEVYLASEAIYPDEVDLVAKVVWLSSQAIYKVKTGEFVHVVYNDRGQVDDLIPANG